MANISITAANVIAPSGSSYVAGKLAGESITTGELVYLKASDGKVWKASTFSLEAAEVIGMAANTAAASQPITVISKSSACAIGSVVTAGNLYFLSATAGKMCQVADYSAASSDYPVYICQAVTASTISFDFTTVPYPAFRT